MNPKKQLTQLAVAASRLLSTAAIAKVTLRVTTVKMPLRDRTMVKKLQRVGMTRRPTTDAFNKSKKFPKIKHFNPCK